VRFFYPNGFPRCFPTCACNGSHGRAQGRGAGVEIVGGMGRLEATGLRKVACLGITRAGWLDPRHSQERKGGVCSARRFYPSSPPTVIAYNKSSSTRVSYPLQKHCEVTWLLPSKVLILATDVPFGRLFLLTRVGLESKTKGFSVPRFALCGLCYPAGHLAPHQLRATMSFT
jgi:hypothetical protein